MIEEHAGDVGCSLPDLRLIAYAFGAVVIAAALAIWAIQKLRPW